METPAETLGAEPAAACLELRQEWRGLTKRELFAAMAMQGMLSNAYYAEEADQSERSGSLASAAVWNADALLQELAKEK